MKYTLNLSRARATGRNKRAAKAVRILQEELEDREGEVSISDELNRKIWERGARKPPAKVTVEVREEDGGKVAYPSRQKSSGRSEGSKSSEPSGSSDYSEVVSGTIDEAKNQIKELEDSELEAVLEAEKENKDRKTLKDWIESRM